MSPEEEAQKNIVSDLQPQFPRQDEREAFIVAQRNEAFQYILQFEDGYLIGAIIVPIQYVDTLIGLLGGTTAPAAPKLEVARS